MLNAKNPACQHVTVTKRIQRWTGEAERTRSPFSGSSTRSYPSRDGPGFMSQHSKRDATNAASSQLTVVVLWYSTVTTLPRPQPMYLENWSSSSVGSPDGRSILISSGLSDDGRYFFPRMASFAALTTLNLTTRFAGILISLPV